MSAYMRRFRAIRWYLPLTVLIVVTRCAAIKELANIQKPELSIAQVKFSDFTFEAVSLIFEVAIKNPNPLSATLAGFDYDFSINNASFVKGEQSKGVVLEALGESSVEIPVTINFKDLYKIYSSLQGTDSSSYALACGFSFDLPVLGRSRIPLSKTGFLPLVKIPRISISGLKLNRISLSGADLDLGVKVDNPNAFNCAISSLDYELLINGLSWGKGAVTNRQQIEEKKSNLLTIPISLNFAQMGQTLYQLVTGNRVLEYQFSGSLNVESSLRLIEMTTVPFAGAGQLRISK